MREARRVEQVYSTHRRFIENVARQHAFNPDVVPDIVQTVGVRLCMGLNGFRGDSELRTWIYTLTVNAARDHYRAESKHTRAVDAVTTMEIDQVVDPDEQVIHSERLEALQDAIDRLRPVHQTALRQMLRNQAQPVPVESDEKESTLKSRRFKARRLLRGMLAGDPRIDQ